MQVIKQKTDTLMSSQMSQRDQTDYKVAAENSLKPDANQADNLNSSSSTSIPLSSNSSKETEIVPTIAPMNEEEIHFLMVDIGHKLFHLKKNLCESVEPLEHEVSNASSLF